jgi:RNA polymerase sigma-32 factor
MGSVFESASLRSYRASLSGVEPLDRETERKLARLWKAGDERAGAKIVRACLPFVIAIAIEYRRWGVPMEDIIQQGNLGLLRAAKKFDPDRECRLATYASYWIRAEIREYVVRAYRVVRIGTTKGERRALRAYRTTNESDPETLARVSGLSIERVEKLLPMLSAREVSIEASALPEHETRFASRDHSPEDEAAAHEAESQAKVQVRSAMHNLSEREQMIVRERMMSDEPVTLAELGSRLGVSKERVRQLEARAKGKLRSVLADPSEQTRELAIAI